MRSILRLLDPRRSLASAIGSLVFALSIGIVLVASVWVDDIVRTNLLDIRGRQLESVADNFADALNLDIALRLQSVRALAAMLATEVRADNHMALQNILRNLQRASPELETITVTDTRGRTLASTRDRANGTSAEDRSWLVAAMKELRAGEVRVIQMPANTSPRAEVGAPSYDTNVISAVVDYSGNMIGAVVIRLSGRWLLDLAGSFGDGLQSEFETQALVLDEKGRVLIGAASAAGKRFDSTIESTDRTARTIGINSTRTGADSRSHIERMADGNRFLVARVIPDASDALHALGWRVVVREPLQFATQHARLLQIRITAVLIGLGLLAALLGVFLVRRVTRDLEVIARSADALRQGDTQKIAVPSGRNEVARLGHALDELFTSLQHERGALQALNAELDQRVVARTREIERLAQQARNTAVVRERLKLARDLHDTLAHSMMTMLSEIRLLKRLLANNPGTLAEELIRAEEAAHEGLKEVRAAIAQIRFNAVSDAGLAAAINDFVKLFVERTGIAVDFTSDAAPGTFADEQAETLFRIAEEAMRNIERHSGATRVAITLHEHADGHGLTLTIADNGIGFDASVARPGHYGLTGLREQAQLIGAVLTICSTAQQGTTISIALTPGLDA